MNWRLLGSLLLELIFEGESNFPQTPKPTTSTGSPTTDANNTEFAIKTEELRLKKIVEDDEHDDDSWTKYSKEEDEEEDEEGGNDGGGEKKERRKSERRKRKQKKAKKSKTPSFLLQTSSGRTPKATSR